MKFLKAALFGVLVLLAGSANTQTYNYKYKMDCYEVMSNPKVYRCTNIEVVCYVSEKGDLFCKFFPN